MALRKEPARRYASVQQFSEDIRRHLASLPVIAHRDTMAYRSAKFISRNKVAVFAAALVILALIGGLLTTALQARAAREQRDRAQLAQAQTERLNAFLQNLLGSANPEGMGRDVKVVQVLDAVAKDLDRDLASQPELQAQAHLTLAHAYERLREAAPAEEQTRAAVAISEKFLGEDNPVRQQATAFLARALAAFRRFEEATPLLRQALTAERRHPSADRNQLGVLLLTLSHTLTETGHLSEAALLTEEGLKRARLINGPQSAELANGWNALGALRAAMKDTAGAEVAYRESIAIYRRFTPHACQASFRWIIFPGFCSARER